MRRLTGLTYAAILLLLVTGRPAIAQSQPTHPLTGQPLAVLAARAAEHGDVTRFVVEFSHSVEFATAPGSGPKQIVITLPELAWPVDPHPLGKGIGLLQQYTYTVVRPGVGQLSLETREAAVVQKAFLIPPAAGNGYRLVIDLAAAGTSPPLLRGETTPTLRGETTTPPPRGDVTPTPFAQTVATSVATGPIPALKSHAPSHPHDIKPVIVIDPGHGGVDPGATSLSGAYEKNIVLALAHEVKAELDKDGKVVCILTRDRDVFIPLRERVSIARGANADLFMSLHADTVAESEIHGLSVYTLSQNASDAEAQALADKENKADIVAGIDLSNESPEVTNILIDLVQRESMNHSAVFAHAVIDEVNHETHQLLQNTHRFAGFAVLKAPDIPSVLVETGYLSNPRDEQMLRRPEYRAKLAVALARAIEQYFAHPRKGHHV